MPVDIGRPRETCSDRDSAVVRTSGAAKLPSTRLHDKELSVGLRQSAQIAQRGPQILLVGLEFAYRRTSLVQHARNMVRCDAMKTKANATNQITNITSTTIKAIHHATLRRDREVGEQPGDQQQRHRVS